MKWILPLFVAAFPAVGTDPVLAPAVPVVVFDDACPVDDPDPQAAAYSADLTFPPSGDTAHVFIRRKVSIGESDAAWRARICAAIKGLGESAGYPAVIVDHEWLVP